MLSMLAIRWSVAEAIREFLKAASIPVSVPIDYMTKRNVLATSYLPSPPHLQYSDLAIAEDEALCWYWLKRWA